jgi:MFS family permease
MGVAGLLGGFPVVAGPVLLVETLLHGAAFGADAAAGTLLALAALTAFVVVYGQAAGKLGPVACALCGWSAFLLGVLVLSFVQPPPVLSLIFVGACFAAGLRLLPPAAEAAPSDAEPPRWDLPARAGAALLLVLGLTAVSGALGPHLSGLLAPFPIITSVLAVFTYAHAGVDQALLLLRNFLLGFYGFAAFCFVLAISLPDLPTAAAFGVAAAALIVQSATLVLRSRLAPALLEQGA